jgi:ATP-dependent Clp protease ATP-binding subunit ClpC
VSWPIAVYQRRRGHLLEWTTLGLGPHNLVRQGRSSVKLRAKLAEDLRKTFGALEPHEAAQLVMPKAHLERLRLSLTLKGDKGRRHANGRFPIVVEARRRGPGHALGVAYHPARPDEWFPVDPEQPLDELATRYLQTAWADLDDEHLAALETDGKDGLKVVGLELRTRSLLDSLKKKGEPERSGEAPKRPLLPRLGVDLTVRAADERLDPGVARPAYRTQLARLVAQTPRQSTVLVGPSGVGKSVLVRRLVHDLLEADGYPAHRNLDRVSHVWSIAAKRLIAGMSYVGEWEQRCVDLVEEVRRGRALLYVEDLAAFGRVGKSRGSDRSLADFFRGPVARGELTLVGECTPEQLSRLEADAPAFAALFQRVEVRATGPEETLRLMIQRARGLELEHSVEIDPVVYRIVLELGGALGAGKVMPGRAIDLLERLCRSNAGQRDDWTVVDDEEVVELIAARTGLPRALLFRDGPLPAENVRAILEREVMGQPVALEAAVDLVQRVRAGLVDPRRPYSVMLFTGPTGTGKTELVKALVRYLYSDEGRLLRFDMGELSGPDAAARLIGDAWQPKGLLTEPVKQQPFCVVLFDEIEKAHPSVLNLLLQLFDEGRLTDAGGETADFRHAVVVMTSNLGAREKPPVGFGEDPTAVVRDVAKAVREFFPPELFNRIDRVVPFGPLSLEVAERVAVKEMNRMLARRGLLERRVFVDAQPGAVARMTREGFAAPDGARSIRRYLERHVGTVLGDHLSREAGAAVRIGRIGADEGGFSVQMISIREAEPEPGALALEPLLDAPAETLRAELVQALDFVRGLEQGPDLVELGERMRFHLEQHNVGRIEHARPLFDQDILRHRVRALREELEEALGADEEAELAQLELQVAATVTRVVDESETKIRVLDRRHVMPRGAHWTRTDLVERLGQAYFLETAMRRIHEPDEHDVFVEIVRVGGPPKRKQAHLGSGRDEGDVAVRRLAALYAAGLDDGSSAVVDGAWAGLDGRGGPYDESAGEAPMTQAVLRIAGPCVRTLLGGDHGTHLQETVAHGGEVLRVRVWPTGGDQPAAEVLKAGLEHTARGTAPLVARDDPADPSAVPPLVRRLRFGADGSVIELEDHRLGWVWSGNGKLESLWRTLWLLRMSRRTS